MTASLLATALPLWIESLNRGGSSPSIPSWSTILLQSDDETVKRTLDKAIEEYRRSMDASCVKALSKEDFVKVCSFLCLIITEGILFCSINCLLYFKKTHLQIHSESIRLARETRIDKLPKHLLQSTSSTFDNRIGSSLNDDEAAAPVAPAPATLTILNEYWKKNLKRCESIDALSMNARHVVLRNLSSLKSYAPSRR